MILVLGVVDIPYADKSGITTGDVAEILEAKYDVMGRFAQLHINGIADALEDSFAGAMDNLLGGNAPSDVDVFGLATGEIEEMFRQYISDEEIVYTGAPGVPTKAALMGVNHRLEHKRGPRRPSFRDTGQYQNSFKAWVEK